MTSKLQVVAVWHTREWGRTWVGCEHGTPASGAGSVRICVDCFEQLTAEPQPCNTLHCKYGTVQTSHLPGCPNDSARNGETADES